MADTYTVLAGALRLRKTPPDGEVLTILPKGQSLEKIDSKTVTATGGTQTWLQVKTNIHERDFEGYINNDYVMHSEPLGQRGPFPTDKLAVDANQLKALTPTARDWIISDLADHFDVALAVLTNERQLCHFLAQAAHESDGFRTLEEYGGPSYWKKYDGRADLGNTFPGDGALFHGRGLFQLTGRTNYQKMGIKLNLPLVADPDKAAEAESSLRIACEYWTSRNLSHYADDNDITTITRKINGGLNGLEQRKRYYRRAWSIWGKAGEPAGV